MEGGRGGAEEGGGRGRELGREGRSEGVKEGRRDAGAFHCLYDSCGRGDFNTPQLPPLSTSRVWNLPLYMLGICKRG
jgi:hypothetical protein